MKILFIAYYYPPMGGAGVQRALKFSKYLPDFDVQPVVLAAHDPGYVSDASLADEIPASVAVHRVEHRPLLQRVLAWRDRGASARAGRAAPVTSGPSPVQGRLRDAALGIYASLHFPDDKAAWTRRALVEGRHILRAERVDLIFSTAPPMSTHALAARLSREFGLPWVADFRDLWTDNPGYAAPAWRRALDRRVEATWLRQAAGIVTVTPSWQRLLALRVGSTRPVAFIPNGYDEADFDGASASPRDDRVVRLVHTGTFYGQRDPSALLDGLAGYLATAAVGAMPLRVRLVGNMGARFEARLAQFDRVHPGVIERVPYVPHRQALAEMMAADVLLLVVGGGPGEVGAGTLPGKIFEYLRACKPVLLLGDDHGDAAALIRQHANGWVVDAERPSAIAQALEAIMASASLPGGPAAADGASGTDEPTLRARGKDCIGAGVRQFERRELARQLAAFLERCTEGRDARA